MANLNYITDSIINQLNVKIQYLTSYKYKLLMRELINNYIDLASDYYQKIFMEDDCKTLLYLSHPIDRSVESRNQYYVDRLIKLYFYPEYSVDGFKNIIKFATLINSSELKDLKDLSIFREYVPNYKSTTYLSQLFQKYIVII